MQAPQQKFTRQLPPAGTHIARVTGIIYIGTVKGQYKGQPTEGYKVRITWELPQELAIFKENV